jgi:hypothetical protein
MPAVTSVAKEVPLTISLGLTKALKQRAHCVGSAPMPWTTASMTSRSSTPTPAAFSTAEACTSSQSAMRSFEGLGNLERYLILVA